MNVLVVDNTSADRRKSLIEIVCGSIPSSHVVQFEQAASLNGTLVGTFPTDQRFDLIVHHCGVSNPELSILVEGYGKLCQQKTWLRPAIILFSGASVDDVRKDYADDQSVCAINDKVLLKNLGAFLAAWEGLSPPWEILRTGSPYEPALQALSALLPFGLLAETRKGLLKEAVQAMATKQATDNEFATTAMLPFEQELQEYICRRILNGESVKMAQEFHERHGPLLKKLGAEFEGEINALCKCERFEDWNRMIAGQEDAKGFRDKWLERVAK